MKARKFLNSIVLIAMLVSMLFSGTGLAIAKDPPPPKTTGQDKKEKITQADRQAAAERAEAAGFQMAEIGMAEMNMPNEAPHYFSVANYANSPLPGNAVVEWNAIAQEILQPSAMAGMPMEMMAVSMAEAGVILGYVQAAVYDALVAIEGGYQPYNPAMPQAGPETSRDSAIASAAYHVLAHYVPSPTLDQKYQAALKAIANSDAKQAGITVGQQAAQGIITLRAADGLSAEGTYTVPDAAPGVWQPTMMMSNGMMAPPIDPWMAVMVPFMLETPWQFRPEPPPALDSEFYAQQLNEVKEIGGAMSMMRTPEQTEAAKFWTANHVTQYNAAFRDVARSQGLGLLETARLLAMGNMVGTDSLIACFDAKYTYSFWRPVTAIRNADQDGNDLTEANPDWMPLLMTPNHPEYVAGHACFASAQAEVFSQFLGTEQIELDLASDATNTIRHYETAADLRTEIVNVRTWGGIHFRNSSELAVTLGQNVAQYALANNFQPADSRAAHLQFSGGIRKFVDGLPGLGSTNANNLGQYIPVAVPDTTTYPGSDYYEIAVVQYREKMHTDLPPTLLRGYVQLSTSVVPGAQVLLTNELLDGSHSPIQVDGQPVYGVDKPHYLGPTILATKDRPVRILFRNLLPTGVDGDLFIPVDTTVMGSGMGPLMYNMEEEDPQNPMCGMSPKPYECYTDNRATLHLHGGISPWISDGTPHQWITPANENTPYPQGVSVVPVPDMNDSGAPDDGAMTFYYTNQQSARLMFYHDHAWGITRLNVYAGEAAAYLITDDMEKALISSGILPADQIPLVVQDKTFVPSEGQLATEDPTWDMTRWGGPGDLWLPHVYSPAQNPGDSSGVNQFGRWAYGPWFWPPTSSIEYGPVPNPHYDPNCDADEGVWCEPPMMPGVPYNSMGMEAFMDTPVVNGTAYPYLEIDPKAYRFRVLNAANDRFFNLSLYVADPNNPTEVALNAAEVEAALEDQTIFPTPDLQISPAGPSWIQIGTEGGFLPAPTVIPPQPITWVNDPTVFNAGNVDLHSLLLGPAERADVVVDFSKYAGQTLILYNDAPAAFPARDPRYDYYTGSADLTETGGVPTIEIGYGPNTRTVMQIRIKATTPAAPYNLTALVNAFKSTKLGGMGVFEDSQHPIIVGQGAYNTAYGTAFRNTAPNDGFVRITDFFFSFDTLSGVKMKDFPLQPKMIQDEMGEAFEHLYGRMSGNLGVEAPFAQAGNQNMILYAFMSPPTEVLKGIELPEGASLTPITSMDDGTQIWKITHNGVDTHPIHFHLYDVQVVNRVGWDGIIRPPEPNELGWKDTVRISPLEDTIVALRPLIPHVPWDLPNSVRLLDPSMPEGAVLVNTTLTEQTGKGMMAFDPTGEPIDIINHYVNFGWEYVWHCHILSHEEMDMMRPQVVGVTPRPPTDLTIVVKGTSATLTWKDNSANETAFILQRASDGNFTSGLVEVEFAPNVTSYVDNTIKNNTTYYYRVFARNLVGDTWDYSDPALNEGAGFPTLAKDSVFSNTVMLGSAPLAPAAPTNLVATLLSGPQVSLTWRDNANNETGFLVERSVNGGAFALLASLGVNTTAFTDTSVSFGNTYEYRVAAVNAGGQSAYSNTVLMALPALPAAPANLSGTAVRQGNNARVTLNWTDRSNNETGFTIQRANNLNFTVGVVTSTVGANTTTFTTGNIARNTTYYFRVRSFNQTGTSAWSNIYIVTTP